MTRGCDLIIATMVRIRPVLRLRGNISVTFTVPRPNVRMRRLEIAAGCGKASSKLWIESHRGAEWLVHATNRAVGTSF